MKTSRFIIVLFAVLLFGNACASTKAISFKTSKLVTSTSTKMSEAEAVTMATDKSTDPADFRLLAFNRSVKVKVAVASNESAPVMVLDYLSRDPDVSVRVAVASNIHTAPVTLTNMFTAKNATYEIYVALAGNTSTPGPTVDSLSTASNPGVKMAAATNPNLPDVARLKLEKDPNVQVKGMLAGNKKTSQALLSELSKLSNPAAVRAQVAGNISAPLGALIELATDKIREVRLAVVDNPKLPLDGLLFLANDEDDEVRTKALQRLQALQ